MTKLFLLSKTYIKQYDYFVDREDLTLCTLKLLLTSHVVPELRFGTYFILGEDSKSQDLWIRLLLGGMSSAQHDVLTDLSKLDSYLHLEGWISRVLSRLLSKLDHGRLVDVNIIINIPYLKYEGLRQTASCTVSHPLTF